jgi:hypothetical protein
MGDINDELFYKIKLHTEQLVEQWIISFYQGTDLLKEINFNKINLQELDKIIVKINEKHYHISLIVIEKNKLNRSADFNKLKDTEECRKLFSILYDSVNRIFQSKVELLKKEQIEEINDIIPIFNNDILAFEFKKINKFIREKIFYKNNYLEAMNTYNMISEQISIQIINQIDKEKISMMRQDADTLLTEMNYYIGKYDGINEDDIKNEADNCIYINQLLSEKKILAFNILEYDSNLSDKISRLPKIMTIESVTNQYCDYDDSDHSDNFDSN